MDWEERSPSPTSKGTKGQLEKATVTDLILTGHGNFKKLHLTVLADKSTFQITGLQIGIGPQARNR